jgi:hypothetical protein
VRRALEYELRVGRDLFKCILELLWSVPSIFLPLSGTKWVWPCK